MMLQGFQPVPTDNVEADQHTASVADSEVPLQPLDRIGRGFHGSRQAGTTVLSKPEEVQKNDLRLSTIPKRFLRIMPLGEVEA